MFLVGAQRLSQLVPEDRIAAGALYPSQNDLRTVSREIAVAVVREARDAGVGRHYHDEEIEAAVVAAMWWPDYVEYKPEVSALGA